ncbi:MAG: hypothetical protein KDK70_01390 [Myxococcales bacterium]|nr:hypothetical protein [Myxococcales bacterium]
MRVAIAASVLLALVIGSLAQAAPEPAPSEPTAPSEPAEPAGPTASDEAKTRTPVVSDGPVAVTTRLSPDPSNVGDLLVFEVVAAYPRDVRVNLPPRLDFAPLHHVRTEEGEPEPTGDGLRKTFRIELQHFEVGPAQIPAFPLTYVDADGEVHTVQIPARPFTVESLLANEDDPQRRGEDPPISREYPDTLTETIVWSALGTLLLALGAWLVLRRLWGRERAIVLPPPIPPHQVAFEALDDLERGELLAQGQVQRYYVELTEIAKGYIEGRFGVLALDRTTDEIRQALLRDGARVAPLSPDEVVAFLQRCDLVKFARWQPPEEQSREALGEVRQMVQSSLPDSAQAGEGEGRGEGEGEGKGEGRGESEAEPDSQGEGKDESDAQGEGKGKGEGKEANDEGEGSAQGEGEPDTPADDSAVDEYRPDSPEPDHGGRR